MITAFDLNQFVLAVKLKNLQHALIFFIPSCLFPCGLTANNPMLGATQRRVLLCEGVSQKTRARLSTSLLGMRKEMSMDAHQLQRLGQGEAETLWDGRIRRASWKRLDLRSTFFICLHFFKCG